MSSKEVWRIFSFNCNTLGSVILKYVMPMFQSDYSVVVCYPVSCHDHNRQLLMVCHFSGVLDIEILFNSFFVLFLARTTIG